QVVGPLCGRRAWERRRDRDRGLVGALPVVVGEQRCDVVDGGVAVGADRCGHALEIDASTPVARARGTVERPDSEVRRRAMDVDRRLRDLCWKLQAVKGLLDPANATESKVREELLLYTGVGEHTSLGSAVRAFGVGEYTGRLIERRAVADRLGEQIGV